MTSDLPRFARGWEPRTFFAIARKVNELKPEVSLIEIMQKQDITLYQYLETEYLQRPMDSDSE